MTGTPPSAPDTPTPTIIAENSHPIEERMIDKDAVFVMRKLNRAGFSSYLVGGGVRDLYLGKRPKDFDISTNARPGQIRKIFPNSATIGRRFRLVQVFFKGGKVIEVSTLRSLSEHDLDGPEAVLAPNNTYGRLPEDAQRRDLTINALFYELENRTIIDYIGGVQDLDDSIIRMVGEPEKRINRDPVRIIRALRHSARTGFRIEEKTWKAICANHEKLPLCPPSRIRDELLKDLYGGASANWFGLAVESEMFFTLFPFYRPLLLSPKPSQRRCLEQLNTVFTILDRHTLAATGKRARQLPKYFTLALVLLPWAEASFGLSKQKIKGPALFHLAKKIRDDVDTYIGVPLNLRKSLRQEVVTLLANLPQFVQYAHNGNKPKWLKKKSYYAKCYLFFSFFNEISTTSPEGVDFDKLIDKMAQSSPAETKRNRSSKRKNKPAFSPKKKGGVFGFRK